MQSRVVNPQFFETKASDALSVNKSQERIKLLTSEAKRGYAESLSLIPIPYGSKNPNRKDWSQDRYTLAEIIFVQRQLHFPSTTIRIPVPLHQMRIFGEEC